MSSSSLRSLVPPRLTALAQACNAPLYIVGGWVRDALGGVRTGDIDLAAPIPEQEFSQAARACSFLVRAVYPATGTVKIDDCAGLTCEFTRFRSDRYVRGMHAPQEVMFTDDIAVDARRRDFCANAVYYDIAADALRDPLGGIEDIRTRTLRTVAPAEKVFGEDGLRLMRLARIAAQTGFSPDEACLAGASKNAALIRDIAPERIFREMDLLLHADGAEHGSPYRGACILRDTGVLRHTMPELAAGDGMRQPAHFHKYDVLEHSFRCMAYAPPSIRWAALLHDVGKPFCMNRDGNFHAHAEEGGRIAANMMRRMRAPGALRERTKRLVALHMRDCNGCMREGKVRQEIVHDYELIDDLLALKQADYTACKDDPSPAPTVVKWKRIYADMVREGVPFTLQMLAVNGDDAAAAGIAAARRGAALRTLQGECIMNGARNERGRLIARLQRIAQADGANKEIP